MSNGEPTFHPQVYTYWEGPGHGNGSKYREKEATHGTRCGGCGECAHCPTKHPNDPMHNHAHGWWREYLKLGDDVDVPDDAVEWVVSMESYVGGLRSGDHPDRMRLSSIQISIYPIYNDHVEDPNDRPNIVARAKTYCEVLKKYEEYINIAARRERARIME